MSTKVPHPHAELIKQWADGATIEVAIPKNHQSDCCHRFDAWMQVKSPEWNPDKKYRVKPEPKPDVVLYGMIGLLHSSGQLKARIQNVFADGRHIPSDTCMFVFDGETGKLKDAQVLAHE